MKPPKADPNEDDVLRRMLKTPPQAHKDKPKAKPSRQKPKGDGDKGERASSD